MSTTGDPRRGWLSAAVTKAIADGGGAMVGGAVGAVHGAVVGGAVGGLVGGVAAPVLTYVAEYDRRSAELAEDMVRDARVAAGMTAEQLSAWTTSDDHLRVLVGLIETAWRTRDEDKRRALSRALAEVLTDDARLDVVGLLAEAWRDIEAPHVRVLAHMEEREGDTTWTAQLSQELPSLALGMPALVAALQRTGCIDQVNATLGGDIPLRVTDFGRLMLAHILSAHSGEITERGAPHDGEPGTAQPFDGARRDG